MIHAAPPCRCCGSADTRLRGVIPDARTFAGTRLERPLAGGSLHRCTDCGFVFRHPIYGKAEYDRLYRAGEGTTWDEPDRVDQELVRQMLTAAMSSGSVLDVGCGTGGLLAPLTGRFQAYGIEINAAAARIAESRSVRVLASDLDEASRLERQFDAVVSCDVIEHVSQPLDFLALLLARTVPGGRVIVSTGNADAWSWRLAGSRFWYCYLPEHISFVSPAWFAHHAPALGACIEAVRRFAYSPYFRLPARALRLGLMALFRLSPTTYYRLLPRERRDNIPVGRGITRDHFVVVVRRKA